MKGIPMKTWEVCAILDNRKTVTRQAVKPRYCDSVFEMFGDELCEASPYKPPIDNGDGTTTRFVRQYIPCKPPYRPGDILYVRETWCKTDCFGLQDGYVYNANDNSILESTGFTPKWRSPIHMPREAARIFLRVTGVRVERLQDCGNAQAKDEGCTCCSQFARIWDSTIKPADRALYGWEANPWVWVNEFERIKRPKGA